MPDQEKFPPYHWPTKTSWRPGSQRRTCFIICRTHRRWSWAVAAWPSLRASTTRSEGAGPTPRIWGAQNRSTLRRTACHGRYPDARRMISVTPNTSSPGEAGWLRCLLHQGSSAPWAWPAGPHERGDHLSGPLDNQHGIYGSYEATATGSPALGMHTEDSSHSGTMGSRLLANLRESVGLPTGVKEVAAIFVVAIGLAWDTSATYSDGSPPTPALPRHATTPACAKD